jgi:hypothetical protein
MKKLIIIFTLLGLLQSAQAQKLKTENVILITLDGFRWQELFGGIDSTLLYHKEFTDEPKELAKQFWANTPEERRTKLLPFFWTTIAKEGQIYGNRWKGNLVNVTNNQWFSYLGYNEILSGFQDERINSNDKINNPNQTVLEFVHQQKGFENKVAAFCSWDVFPYIINTERSKIPVNAGYAEDKNPKSTVQEKLIYTLQQQIPQKWSSVRFDAFTHHLAKAYLQANQPRLLYISYGETDDFAHDGEYHHYIKSAYQTDQFIKDLWDFVQSHPKYKNKTTLIISTDHGRGQEPIETWKSHGQKTKDSDQIWIAFLGPDTQNLGEVTAKEQLYQNQIAKTLASFLGLDYKNAKEVGEAIKKAIGK